MVFVFNKTAYCRYLELDDKYSNCLAIFSSLPRGQVLLLIVSCFAAAVFNLCREPHIGYPFHSQARRSWFANWSHIRRERRNWREKVHCRWVGGRVNKQGNLPLRFVSTLPTRILKVSKEDWMAVFSHGHSPDGLNILLKAASLKQLLLWQRRGEYTFLGQGSAWEASNCPGPASRSTSVHILSNSRKSVSSILQMRRLRPWKCDSLSVFSLKTCKS